MRVYRNAEKVLAYLPRCRGKISITHVPVSSYCFQGDTYTGTTIAHPTTKIGAMMKLCSSVVRSMPPGLRTGYKLLIMYLEKNRQNHDAGLIISIVERHQEGDSYADLRRNIGGIHS